MLPFVWDKGFGFERYVEYALDVPMYFLYRNGKYEDATQQRCTFREYMEGRMPQNPGAPQPRTSFPCQCGSRHPAEHVKAPGLLQHSMRQSLASRGQSRLLSRRKPKCLLLC